jgi:protein-tyrosine phosphatase
MRQTAKRNGVQLHGEARQIQRSDLQTFDLILCSDSDILMQVRKLGATSEQARLMLDFHPALAGSDVPDPYYGGADGFDEVFSMLDEACRNLANQILKART